MSRLGKCECGEEIVIGIVLFRETSPCGICKKCFKLYPLEIKEGKTHWTIKKEKT